jgi:DNA oxidative demethylase
MVMAEGQPEGLVYHPDALSETEEQQVLDVLRGMELRAVVMRGQASRRLVRHFGLDYDYESWELVPADPFPESLGWLRDRSAALAGVAPAALAQILVTRYPPGATIGWHRDAPVFGPQVIGVSLAAPCRLRFQRGKGDQRQVAETMLEPRSVYVLSGPARSSWQHSIPPTKDERYSITFRTLRSRRGGAQGEQ